MCSPCQTDRQPRSLALCSQTPAGPLGAPAERCSGRLGGCQWQGSQVSLQASSCGLGWAPHGNPDPPCWPGCGGNARPGHPGTAPAPAWVSGVAWEPRVASSLVGPQGCFPERLEAALGWSRGRGRCLRTGIRGGRTMPCLCCGAAPRTLGPQAAGTLPARTALPVLRVRAAWSEALARGTKGAHSQ